VPITAGSRLGPYEIVAPLGAGGMGEVWRARDTRLDRSVAIKLLPAEFAENAQLRLRLEREARAISQLNHPHICTLYDVGDGYLVMELLDGESLADRLSKGPLPIEQVIRYGVQIAEALDRAHKAGIVHRDLKPANVMITKSGAKLLDFGLAKPMDDAPVAALTSLRTERRSLTEEGTIVGTFQYMAPEQLEGAELDHRADIFALGAVLYEMATGRRAFQGKSKASLIASILTSEPPPISVAQPMTPAALDRLVRTCLAKEPDDRFQSAHDVALELRWVTEAPAVAQPLAKRRRDLVAWSVAAVLAVAVAVLGFFAWQRAAADKSAPPVRLSILPPDGTEFDFRFTAAPPAISPDGMKVVFGATKDAQRHLWLRRLDNATSTMLPGTVNATFPFWSPDSRFIAFFADGKLKRQEIGGGAPVAICDVAEGRGGSWNADGTIIFGGRYTPIFKVATAGGSPSEVTAFDASQHDLTHRWPQFLPDGRHFLFLASPVGSEDPANMICVGSLDVKMRKPVLAASSQPLYLDGHLLFSREQLLMALKFDEKALQGVGEAVAVGEQQIEPDVILSRSVLSVSRNGTLLYQIGEGLSKSQLAWFERSGKPAGTAGDPMHYGTMSLSRDERFVFFSPRASPTTNIWMFDVQRGVKSRITFGASRDIWPQPSPDGTKLLYAASSRNRNELRLRDLATGVEKTLVTNELGIGAPSWSADGRTIAFGRVDRITRGDVWTMSLADGTARPYLATDAVENFPRISPDGRWMAYQSNESGRAEIYVAPIPPTGAKWQVSASGGLMPHWRGDGKELFYVSDLKLMAVPIALGPTPIIGQAQMLFPIRPVTSIAIVYDQTSDGQKFLVNSRTGDDPAPRAMTVVQRFDNELRAATRRR
jgi:eukaryotic-like serine/threonine-protein kinase